MAADGGGVVRTFLFAPMCPTPEAALDWFEARGATGPAALFRGPDGSVRGMAELSSDDQGEQRRDSQPAPVAP